MRGSAARTSSVGPMPEFTVSLPELTDEQLAAAPRGRCRNCGMLHALSKELVEALRRIVEDESVEYHVYGERVQEIAYAALAKARLFDE